MARDWYKASAPGTLMLMGEHAVLHNKSALCLAINKRLSALLKPRTDNIIKIFSVMGEMETNVSQILEKDLLHYPEKFNFVLATIKTVLSEDRFSNASPQGFELSIHSDIDSTQGLGSSAALVVAVLAVLNAWLRGTEIQNHPSEITRFLILARSIVRAVQGQASGTDIATSILGGIVYYKPEPLLYEKLNSLPLFFAVYSGYKTKTPVVVEAVEKHFQGFESLRDQIFDCMEKVCQAGKQAILREDWFGLGKLMNIQQGLMTSLGVSDAVLNNMIHVLQQDTNIYGAKISGSGKGDCVIALQKHSDVMENLQKQYKNNSIFPFFIPFEISPQGLQYE